MHVQRPGFPSVESNMFIGKATFPSQVPAEENKVKRYIPVGFNVNIKSAGLPACFVDVLVIHV